jgi:hypothetical protein
VRQPRFTSAAARSTVVCLAACAWIACSSTSGSSAASGDGGGDDATAEGGATAEGAASTGADAGETDAAQESSTSSGPCDASIVLPTDGATGTACGKCIEDHCGSGLATCQLDCLCVSSIECLAANDNNYTLCTDALAAIGAGNPGLTVVARCIAMSCISLCNTTD